MRRIGENSMTFAAPTFAAQWRRSVDAHGARPFLVFEASDGTVSRWTYREFDDVVARTATQFAAAGADVSHGVHLALTNSPSFVASWLAATGIGSYIVPSDPMATAPELAEHIARTKPVMTVVSTARRDVADAALALVAEKSGEASIPTLVAVDEDDALCAGLATFAGGVNSRIESWPEPAGDDRAGIMFTSGTTGRPKGVVITQANYAFAGSTMAAAASLGHDDRHIVVLPLFHVNAQYYSFAASIAAGASVALMPTFSASRFVEQAARHQATHASLFAGPMRMILARGGPWTPTDDEPALVLRHCWFAQNVTQDQYDTISQWFGCRPRQLYGMTETIPAVLTARVDDPHPESMGVVTDGCIVEVHDADGNRAAPGDVGDVVVGGEPGVTLFDGYLDDPDTTAASYRGEWFVTGDRARTDSEGRFYFDGRRSDVLKVSGENVSVVEVETVIGAHPDVFDVVVVGAPDDIRDEVPVAFVVPELHRAAGGADLPERLAAWCEERLGKVKRPRSFTLVDELPRTSVGKVRKFLLADAAASSTVDTTTPDPARPDSDPNLEETRP